MALQEAVSPGRTGSGLVGLRAFVSDPSLGLAPGTQLLVGLARAARGMGSTALMPSRCATRELAAEPRP